MKNLFLKSGFALMWFAFSTINVNAQLQVTANNNATQLAQTLAGAGVTISNPTLNCPSLANDACGTFVGTASNLGIAGGVLLTSGSVTNAVGPNVQSSITTSNNITFNDPDLMTIDPLATNDVCILEFDAVPTCSTMSFTFAFGSDEYPEFVNSQFNDAFGIFVTGANPSGPAYTGYNMARIPVSLVPVSINNVNNGTSCPSTGPCTNCGYYYDNCSGGPTVEYDGFTDPITVTLSVVPCGSYHFKLGVADAGDWAYDSGVFFALQSLVCNTTVVVNTTSTPAVCTTNNGTASVTNVTGGASPYAYTWSTTPVQNTSTATGLAPGTYTVTVVDANGCLSGFDTITVTNTGGFATSASQVDITCFGYNNGSATVTPNGGTAPYTYAWSTTPPQTSQTISNIPAGNYTCVISDATGCTQTSTFTITQPAAVAVTISGSTNANCFGSNDGTATASATGGNGPYNYSWNTSPPQAGATVTNLIAGNYIVTATDINGCTFTQSVTITEPSQIVLSTTSATAQCGIADGTASVTATGGSGPYTYLWLSSPTQSGQTATGLNGGNYSVIVTDINGCATTQNVVVAQNPPPVASFFTSGDTIDLLDPIVYFFDNSSSTTSWLWDFGDSLDPATSIQQNPSHMYSDSGFYCITLVADPGGVCRDTTTECIVVVAPYTYYVPSAFTPNGDGFNDIFSGYGTFIKEFEMLIFDRWGNQIFKSVDYRNGWDGKVNGKGEVVQQDIYVWKVNIKDAYNKYHKYIGHVALIR